MWVAVETYWPSYKIETTHSWHWAFYLLADDVYLVEALLSRYRVTLSKCVLFMFTSEDICNSSISCNFYQKGFTVCYLTFPTLLSIFFPSISTPHLILSAPSFLCFPLCQCGESLFLGNTHTWTLNNFLTSMSIQNENLKIQN